MTNTNLSARARTRIRRPRSDVFLAFANAEYMSKFWFTRRDQGLKEGEAVTWYFGDDKDAFSFEVLVKELRAPELIVIEWMGPDGTATQVTWTFEESEHGDTILTIEETGFSGSNEAVIPRVLDSTGGFNQVVIAAKAVIENDIDLNIVADHA